MENENVKSAEPSPEAKKPERSKLERVIVWTLIGLLVLFTAVEANARLGYAKTLRDFETAIEETEAPLTLTDFKSKLKAGVAVEGSGEIDGEPTILYRWPSLLKKYELHLTVAPHDSQTLQTYATHEGLASFIPQPMLTGGDGSFENSDDVEEEESAPNMSHGEGAGGPQGPGGGRAAGRGRNPLRQLTSDPIAAELNLSEEQKTQLEDLIESLSSAPDPSATPEERAQQQETRSQEFLQKLKELLDETQFARARQILLHSRGIDALGQEDVAQELKLSQEQREQILSLLTTRREKMMALFQQMRDGEFERAAFGEKRAALEEEIKTQALAVLSEEQKKAWEALLGPAPPQAESSNRARPE